MTDIYQKYDTAFRAVSAFAILKDGKHVANITLKHGGAVTAFVHWIGLQMTTARAGGGGYDRASAAVEAAAAKIAGGDAHKATQLAANDFVRALVGAPSGARWSSTLEANGYTVLNVIA